MKVEYFPREMMIADFYKKLLQVKLLRLFRNPILNLREDDIRNMTNLEKLAKMEEITENDDRAKAIKSVQECVLQEIIKSEA